MYDDEEIKPKAREFIKSTLAVSLVVLFNICSFLVLTYPNPEHFLVPVPFWYDAALFMHTCFNSTNGSSVMMYLTMILVIWSDKK